MSLLPKEEIGMEIHETTDQFFRIETGGGKVIINGEEKTIKADDAVIVPAGAQHNVVNTSETENKDGTIHKTKAKTMVDEEDHL